MNTEASPKLGLKLNLRTARNAARKTVQEAADAVGKSRQAVSAWERLDEAAPVPEREDLEALAEFYGITVYQLLGKSPIIAIVRAVPDEEADAWEPNPSLVGIVPQRVYDVAIGYCRRLAAAGLSREDIDEAERLLIDEGYAKLNKRAKRVLTEEEQIEMIDVTWRIMREALSWRGLRA